MISFEVFFIGRCLLFLFGVLFFRICYFGMWVIVCYVNFFVFVVIGYEGIC